MMVMAFICAVMAWLIVAWVDYKVLEINPYWLSLACFASVVALVSATPDAWGVALDHLAGGAVGLVAGLGVYIVHHRGMGQGDIGLFGAMFCVGGLDHMIYTLVLFTGLAFATTLFYSARRQKPFWRCGFPAALPAATTAILMLFVTLGTEALLYA